MIVHSWIRPASALLLLALVLVVFSNSFSGGFEGDSGPLTTQDPRVQTVSLHNVGLAFSQGYWYPTADSNVFRPLVTLSFMLNYAVFGNQDRAAGYHVFNLALHLLNVFLVWRLALAIWKDDLAALFTAAIFSVHPVNVEAVTNVAGRADLMAALGVIVGLLLYVRLGKWTGASRTAALAGIGLAALFGVFSKENAVAVIGLMAIYDFSLRPRPLLWRRLLPAYVAVGLALLLMAAVRMVLFSRLPVPDLPFVDNPLTGAGFWTSRLTACQIVLRYLGLLFWPKWLSWDYSYNQIPMATWGMGIAACGAVVGLAVLAIAARRRSQPACFFGLLFFAALGPTSNLILLIGSIMAERFLYLPSIGFAGCIVAAVFGICRFLTPARGRLVAAACLSIAVGALGYRAWLRNFEWTNGDLLWSSAVQTSPNSFKVHLAYVYGLDRGGLSIDNIDRAISEAQKAVSIVEGLPPLRSTAIPLTILGTLYKVKGDVMVNAPRQELEAVYRQALEAFRRAEDLDAAYSAERRRREMARGVPPQKVPVKGYGPLYQHLADTHRRLGEFAEAREATLHLIALEPLVAGNYKQLAEVDLALGQKQQAIVALWQSYEVRATESTRSDLILAYGSDLDSTGCAITGGSQLNWGCPALSRDRCAAHLGLLRSLLDSGHGSETNRFANSFSPGCPSNP